MNDFPDPLRNSEAAADAAVNAVINYLHECGVEGEEKKRQWIARVFDRIIDKELSH